MSSSERKKKRAANKGFAKLGDLCAHFYHFLGRTPQPTDEEVRAEFIRCRTAWVQYATKQGYSDETKLAFVKQVSLVWKQKMESTTESEIQKSSQEEQNSSTNT